MLTDFNLMISTSRGNEKNVCSEIWYLVGDLGDRSVKVETTGIIGLVVAKTALDPLEIAQRLRSVLRDRPWEFRYTLKITPLQTIVPSRMEEIQAAAESISKAIGENESFRITVDKRHTKLSTAEIIKNVAVKIPRKVNLTSPDKVLLIEVIGESTGLSLIKPTDILHVEKEKRSL